MISNTSGHPLREDWDDLRMILAVAEAGSVSAAARGLGVNHATVLRRIAAFERATGIELFDKTARGYTVPEDRQRIVEAIGEVDAAIQSVARILSGLRAPLSGEVRVTTTDSIGQLVLPRVMADIRREAPELRIEVLSSNTHLDLSRIDAEVTVRPAARMPEDLVGEPAAKLGFGVYGMTGAATTDWLGLAGTLATSAPGQWMAANVDPESIVASADSFLVLAALAAQGHGLAILPVFVGASDPRLAPVRGVMPPMSVDIWVASHNELARVPRIARVRALLTRELAGIAHELSG